MFARTFTTATKQQQQQCLTTLTKRFYTPSIKFVYGDRAAIEKDLASRSARQKWMIDHSAAPAATTRGAVENTARYEGKPLKHGPLTTKVTHMESTWFGNPFNKNPAVPQQFDDKAVDLINMGGAF